MKILVAPLNWGLGHASRCVPLVQRFVDEGHEVILGGDGESLTLLRRHFPRLRYVYLAPLNLRYSAGKRQVWAMLKALPKLWAWSVKDHTMLKALLREEHIDCVVSDNRFGLWGAKANCQSPIAKSQEPTTFIYITHQLHIMLPRPWKWLEPLAERLHARIYTRYNKVWVPDFEDIRQSLAGELSHTGTQFPIIYIGPLSRFDKSQLSGTGDRYDVVAVLSGLEPHRTLLEKEILARYQDTKERLLIVEGLLHHPNTRIKRGNITIVPSLPDKELAAALAGARHIIVRSGYSTIMDLHTLGLLADSQPPATIELIPTPGQPEQEYLAMWIRQKALF